MLARLGADRFGVQLAAHLAANGVQGRDLVRGVEPTTLSVVDLDPSGLPSYQFHAHGTADWQWLPGELPDPLAADVRALHTGSLACVLPPGRDQIEALVRREHHRAVVTLTYDPNLRPAVMGPRTVVADQVHRLIGMVDVVKVSDEDLAWLRPDTDPRAVAREWVRADGGQGTGGPVLVVVTLGAEGAFAVTANGVEHDRSARPVTVVDTVGAGDAFMAGLLGWLDGARSGGARLLGAGGRQRIAALGVPALDGMLDAASEVAALTCARAGADPPTRSELSRWPPPDREVGR
jgi:fructokinase